MKTKQFIKAALVAVFFACSMALTATTISVPGSSEEIPYTPFPATGSQQNNGYKQPSQNNNSYNNNNSSNNNTNSTNNRNSSNGYNNNNNNNNQQGKSYLQPAEFPKTAADAPKCPVCWNKGGGVDDHGEPMACPKCGRF